MGELLTEHDGGGGVDGDGFRGTSPPARCRQRLSPELEFCDVAAPGVFLSFVNCQRRLRAFPPPYRSLPESRRSLAGVASPPCRVLRVLNLSEPPCQNLAAGDSDHRGSHSDVFYDSASNFRADHGNPYLLRPPPFVLVQLDPSKDSGKNVEGSSAHPEKSIEAEQSEKKAEEVAAKKSKARQRDSEAKGKWWPCTTTETELNNLEAESFLRPGSWRTLPESLSPAPEAGEMVVTKALVERGFSFPPSDFFSEILKACGLQPHNISPNSVLAISNHVTLCEGHLRVSPELPLFQYYFSVKKEKVPQTSELATCGSITFMLRPGRVYPPTDRHESARHWSGGFFYLKDVSDPASERTLPPFKNGPASETPAWTQCPHLSESPQLTRAVRRICKLTVEGLTGKDLNMSWFTKQIQPLQHRDRLMFQYTGRDDPMRASKENLSADAIDKRIRLLIKIPRDLHIHVCNKDIHTSGSGTALEALEEGDLGTLVRVPHTGNTDPEAASEAEVPEVPCPSKRKKVAPSSPAAKHAREVLSTAATRKAEAEKKRLKLIDTSNRAQPDMHHFFKSSGGSGSQPPKASKVAKKRTKPSPASIPVTPEVEVPPKASSTAKPDPKDVINVDDLPEDPTTKTGHGDSGKGASSSAPPPEQPTATSAEATAEQYEQKVQLIHATGTLQTHPHPSSSLQKLPLSQRHAEVSAMMEKVWGPANTEMKELSDLESDLNAFFAKHKEVRQSTRKLHEDLRVHVLEQLTEIEGLRQNAENSQSAIRLLETRLNVLEAENESLKNFLKETSEKETSAKKELSEKHARDMAELSDKLKKSQQSVSTLAAKVKSQEAEAEDIEKMIFPSLGFEWTKESTLKRMEAYDEARSSIDGLVEACRGIAKSLSLKRAKTTVIDTMTKLMKQVPELIKDWQESSARGVASLVLATCNSHFPTMKFADIARNTPKVNHSFWYHKYDLPKGFSDAEIEEEGAEEEYYAEGSGSSAELSEEGSDDGSDIGSGDGSGDGSAYVEFEEDHSFE
ncbi:hypothetical protein QYE76_008445 [Lolium multiflorum]|uniref:Transposase (putative) gypsy type domain-containing protein n=1 Tax=Lolium multiflorum TaxID=4521 RepID=A0AAD8TT58_LOLMU|nr:hypothetical protein QYE76_008445 [Lolium multiflorum]